MAAHAGIARAAQPGAKVVQINPTATSLDEECIWSLRGAAGAIRTQTPNGLRD